MHSGGLNGKNSLLAGSYTLQYRVEMLCEQADNSTIFWNTHKWKTWIGVSFCIEQKHLLCIEVADNICLWPDLRQTTFFNLIQIKLKLIQFKLISLNKSNVWFVNFIQIFLFEFCLHAKCTKMVNVSLQSYWWFEILEKPIRLNSLTWKNRIFGLHFALALTM